MTKINDFNRLKIVTIHPPYDTWNNLLARELFNQAVDVRLKGFAKEYPYGVMPVDTADFVAYHNLVCSQGPQGLEVLSAFKSVSLKKCLVHNLPFPALSLVKLAGSDEHVKAVEEIVENCLAREKELIYIASYSMHPKVRENKALLNSLRGLFNAMYVLFTQENNFDEILVGGTMRFKMHERFAKMGHSPLSLKGRELSSIYVEHLAKEQVQVMHLKEFSQEAHNMTKAWLELWEQRLIISEVDEKELLKAA